MGVSGEGVERKILFPKVPLSWLQPGRLGWGCPAEEMGQRGSLGLQSLAVASGKATGATIVTRDPPEEQEVKTLSKLAFGGHCLEPPT